MTIRQKFGCYGTLRKTLCRSGAVGKCISSPIYLSEHTDGIIEGEGISIIEISDKIILSDDDTIKSTEGKLDVC